MGTTRASHRNRNMSVAPADAPPPAEPMTVSVQEGRSVKEEGIPAEDLCPCMACCCLIYSCYFKFPDCCGYDLKGVCICCEERAACKLIMPTTCCKGICQCCCVDERCACPCDDEVPFWIALLGMTCAGGPAKAGTTVVVNAAP